MINTVSELIKRLGGPTKAKEEFQVKTPSVVANWMAENRIPARHHYKGRAICKLHKLRVTAGFWEGMV